MVFEATGAGEAFLLARILFGAVLAFIAFGVIEWPYAIGIGLF